LQARDLIVHGDYRGALKLLEDAARKDPSLASPHMIMYGWLAKARPDLARHELDRAIESNPNDPEPYVILGELALQDRRISEAAIDLDKAEQLLSGYAASPERKLILEHATKSDLAQVAEGRADWKAAESYLRDLLKVMPTDVWAKQRLARALFQQGKAADAYDVLKAAKEIDRENARKARVGEGMLAPEAILAQYYYEYEGPTSKTGNAEKFFRAALRTAPDDLPTRRAVVRWALESGKLDLAKEQAKEALRIERNSNSLRGSKLGHELSGLVALWDKDWAAAESNFEAVNQMDPNDFINKNNLALSLVEQNDQSKKNRALQLAEGNYRDASKSLDTVDPRILAYKPDILTTLAWVYFRRGEFDQAALTLDQASKAVGGLQYASADAATYAAYMLHQKERDWDAKLILENVLKSERAFSMKPEALKLYQLVKDVKPPTQAAPAARTP
jgi:tetratricopeptide (TPR) repeat protein